MEGYLVFPTPQRYFDEYVMACGQLYGDCNAAQALLYPVGVITMQRGYIFENAAGEFGEFERGDRFLLFESRCERISEELLFQGIFPTEEVIRECEWEGTSYRTNIVSVDALLREDLCRKMAGLSPGVPRGENKWMIRESFGHHLRAQGIAPQGGQAERTHL